MDVDAVVKDDAPGFNGAVRVDPPPPSTATFLAHHFWPVVDGQVLMLKCFANFSNLPEFSNRKTPQQFARRLFRCLARGETRITA